MQYLGMFIWMMSMGVFVHSFYDREKIVVGKKIVFRKKNLIAVMFMILVMIYPLLLSGLRFNVGTDYMVYMSKQIPSVINHWSNRVEPLYKVVIFMGHYFGGNQGVFFLTHLIILLFISLAIIKNSDGIVLSIFVFLSSGFFNYSLNIMRQSIAMAIFLFALTFIKKQPKKFIIWILIASMFHSSALIYLLLIVLRKVDINKFILLVSIPVTFFLGKVFRNVLISVTSKFNVYDQYFGSSLDSGKMGWVFFFLNFIVLVLFIVIKNREEKSDFFTNFYLLVQYISTFITVISSSVPNYERIMYLFMCTQILSIPFFYKIIEKRKYKIMYLLLITLGYGIMFYRLFIMSNIGETFPYHSVLFK